MWDGHFTNISVETRVQSPYVDGFFGLPSMMLKSDGRQRVVEILTMFP